MATYYFYNSSDGRTYGIRGSSTLTQEQAQRIFDQQRSAGALIGLKPGQQITPEFQLANGLRTAEAAVLTDIKNAATQGFVPSGFEFLGTAVTAGITSADYAKQPEVTEGIAAMTGPEVTAVLAQANKLTRQRAADATNLGAGKYAFTVPQLERSGYIKPGISSKYLTTQVYSTLSVLNMAGVWTGKEGVDSLNALLQSSGVQDTIQQSLMAAGLNQIAELGIKIDNLPAKYQAGLALLSAIDPNLAAAWAKNPAGVPTIKVYGSLPSGQTSYWQEPQRIVRDAAYAVEFAASRISNSTKNQIQARGYTHTVERQAINSAANQIVGNPKVPEISFGVSPVNSVLLQEFEEIDSQVNSLTNKTQSVLLQNTTVSNAVTKESQLIALRKELVIVNAAISVLREKAQNFSPVPAEFVNTLAAKVQEILSVVAQIDQALQLVSRLLGRRTGV